MISILCFFLDHFHYNLLTLQRLYVCVGGKGEHTHNHANLLQFMIELLHHNHYTPEEVNYFNVQHTHTHTYT